MKLTLENIGKIGEATIEINGITVIAGENNTGKSTVGRALYAIFNCFSNINEQIDNERMRSLNKVLFSFYYELRSIDEIRIEEIEEISKNISNKIHFFRENKQAIYDEVMSVLLMKNMNDMNYLSDSIEVVVDRIKEIIEISDELILNSVSEKKLKVEFNGQVNNIFSQGAGKIKLQIKSQELSNVITNDNIKHVENKISLQKEAVYIDDPFILDDLQNRHFDRYDSYLDHQSHLRSRLLINDNKYNIIDDILVNKKLEQIYQKLNAICDGEVVNNKRNGYKKANSDKVLDMRNLSTGLKTFVILKMLLLNGTISYNGTIILDEPEIHLHPEWQLIFAELIVLI